MHFVDFLSSRLVYSFLALGSAGAGFLAAPATKLARQAALAASDCADNEDGSHDGDLC